jgi:hypothetical protein
MVVETAMKGTLTGPGSKPIANPTVSKLAKTTTQVKRNLQQTSKFWFSNRCFA